MSELDAALVEIFREETDERLDRVVEVLLAIEAGGAPPDAVGSLFRDVHSIKGNAGMVGFDELSSIAHALEDMLEGPRTVGQLPPELVELILRATDVMRRVLEGEPGVSTPMLEELAGVAANVPEGPVDGAGAAQEPPRPTRSIRVSAEKVDGLLDAVGEAVLHQRRIELLTAPETAGPSGPLGEELDRAARLIGEVQESVLALRMLPLSSITGRFARAVRDLAQQENKEVELTITGDETQLDRVILDGISETISHLLSNAVVHGVESPAERAGAGKPECGQVELRAEQRGGFVAIAVSDDGRGVPAELLREGERRGSLAEVLGQAGFSTATEVTQAAGRGVGLDAVKTSVEALGGSLEISSEPGAGACATLLLPLTLALLRVLLFERDERVFGLPLASVVEALTVERQTTLGGQAALVVGGKAIPVADLAVCIGASAAALRQRPPGIVVTARGERVAALCDRLVGEQEVVVKALGPLLARTPGYLGAAILPDSRVALILDPAELVRRLSTAEMAPPASAESKGPGRVLVVDDQFTVRELQRSILEAAGYVVETVRNGNEALAAIGSNGSIDLVVTDIDMPGLDGLGLLEAIRADPTHSHLPVIVLTAEAGDDDRRRGLEAGADAYVVKQEFDQHALLETVGRLLGV